VAEQGLSEAEFSLLWSCLAAPARGWSQSEIASLMAVSAAHVSGLVEGLRCKGHLRRFAGVADRRQRFWRLSPVGRAALETILARSSSWTDPFSGKLDQAQVARLAELLKNLQAELERDEACPALPPRTLSMAADQPSEQPTVAGPQAARPTVAALWSGLGGRS
jgi:DNA-binding MarR family transcriptional regulator